ncbi:uncharacterized protein LAESUDRAFT_716229 [Laetiporus sulphureus 93-53]|uniref:Uncharacterized protein n=1 Tax=Laetiporus sulphureus 93-53 TaxID=1314785 RepID=A0A165CTL1_9APHY|nr:uncharacterized protein LAESUDRAFT_716229 [Laetiporus sulphureus 93-53]KZT03413.1 hypothetical protein LAESUDRAFT_716229 [Laetiporus sulphureus 93-53]
MSATIHLLFFWLTSRVHAMESDTFNTFFNTFIEQFSSQLHNTLHGSLLKPAIVRPSSGGAVRHERTKAGRQKPYSTHTVPSKSAHSLFQTSPTISCNPNLASSSRYVLSVDTTVHTESVLSQCLATSTLNQYGASLQSFMAFCDAENIFLGMHLPADEFLLCAFAASKAGSHGRSSVQNMLSAVRTWHIIQGVAWHGGPHLAYILNAVERLSPDRQTPQLPITRSMLELLHRELNASDPELLCILCAANVAF